MRRFTYRERAEQSVTVQSNSGGRPVVGAAGGCAQRCGFRTLRGSCLLLPSATVVLSAHPDRFARGLPVFMLVALWDLKTLLLPQKINCPSKWEDRALGVPVLRLASLLQPRDSALAFSP